MKSRFFALILLLCSFSSLLLGQYDQRQILLQQAQTHFNMRQYTQAENVYKQVLELVPNDQTAIMQLLNISYMTGNVDKAEETLDRYGAYLPAITLLDQQIQIMIYRGKAEEAWPKVQQSISMNPNDQNRYRTIASHYERRGFFEYVQRLYQLGRRNFNDPNLFALEYANSALYAQRYDLAINEYLSWLERNPANLYFVNNQCKTILEADSTLISVIKDKANSSSAVVLKELLAGVLVQRKDYAQALEVYKNLSPDKLVNFANQQYSSRQDEVAYLAFEYLESIETDVFRKNQYLFNRSTIAYRNLNYQLADSLVTVVIQDSLLNLPQNRWRSGVGFLARKLKSELTLSFTHDPAQAIVWLNEAKDYTRSANQLAEIEVETARLHILNQDLDTAKSILNQVNDKNFDEEKEHYFFLIALFENNIELADSLMNEQIIHRPEGKYTNDAIYLMMHLLNLSEGSKAHFLASYRAYLLQDHNAIDMLSEIFSEDAEEELMILALEWALEFDLKDKALVMLAHDWQDPIAKEYSALMALLLETSSIEQQRQARDFLKQYPNSVFSPEFRSILSSRPL